MFASKNKNLKFVNGFVVYDVVIDDNDIIERYRKLVQSYLKPKKLIPPYETNRDLTMMMDLKKCSNLLSRVLKEDYKPMTQMEFDGIMKVLDIYLLNCKDDIVKCMHWYDLAAVFFFYFLSVIIYVRDYLYDTSNRGDANGVWDFVVVLSDKYDLNSLRWNGASYPASNIIMENCMEFYHELKITL
jgi:hypothetical protein